MNKGKRPQAKKDTLDRRTRAVVDRARSNAGQPHKQTTDYRRKPKHWKGWE